MRPKMRKVSFLLSFILILVSNMLAAQYKVKFSNNYPPFNYLDEKGELVGFNVDILNAIKELYNIDIEISSSDWSTINEALSKNEIQAIGGAHNPQLYDNKFLYTRSTISTSHCFLYNKNFRNNFSTETLRSAKQPKVAMWKNDVLIHYVLSINPSAEFLYLEDYEELINVLEQEDVTCIFAQRITSMYYAEKLDKNFVRATDNRNLERTMGFKVSIENEELATILNNGMEVILSSGEYLRIYDKWIKEYNKSQTDWHNFLKYIVFFAFFISTIIVALLFFNKILQTKVRIRTEDLQHQLKLNSSIMKELETQKNKAEESEKIKSSFLANMSHEIRTPMNGILGFAELLKANEYSSDEKQQFIEIIEQSGNRMLDTINNIIDVSKLESGGEKIQITEVNIKSIISQLYDFFTPEANSKILKLIIEEKSTNSPKSFYTDSYKINSILINLIKNALKFTKEGFIKVEYDVNEDRVEFWITDTGIGISEDKQNAVFDQFVQANSSLSRGFEGSGLGLSITKGYVQLLGGEINLKSELNKGTTFYVRIPNNNLNEEIHVSELTVIEESEIELTSKLKIIIAEDDLISFNYLEHALKDISSTILRAENGIEVVTLVRNNPDTDVVLMDIKMPKQNGFQATKEIRKFNKNIFIIAQTAYSQDNYKEQIIKSGCNHCVTKPIDKNKLIEIIAKRRMPQRVVLQD
jgi:signal transduction histidine kinase/CheY-like chemotaxis protein